jgi:hypothetical protein
MWVPQGARLGRSAGSADDALLGHVRPDGGVQFSRDHTIANIRCTLFALQALYLSARQDAREPAPIDAFQLLV